MAEQKQETNQKPIQEQQQNTLTQKNNNQLPKQDNLFRMITGDSGEALQKNNK